MKLDREENDRQRPTVVSPLELGDLNVFEALAARKGMTTVQQ